MTKQKIRNTLLCVGVALAGVRLAPMIHSEERTLGAPVLRVSGEARNPFSKSVEGNGERKQHPTLKIPFSNGTDLKVMVKVTKECYIGDMEAIYLETGWSGESNVTVSLESFDSQVPYSVSKSVPVKELGGSKVAVSFTLPILSKPVPLGLFICKDSEKTGSCMSKSIQTSEELFSRYDPRKSTNNLDQKETLKISDKSYFFGHLVGYGDGVEITDGAFTESAIAQLQSTITGAGTAQGTTVLDRIKKLHHTLGSLPLVPKDSAVQITLPSVSTAGCG